MKQKFSVNIADVQMNIICDETPELVDTAVAELDRQIRSLTAGGSSCTKTEAALLSALDYSARVMHREERIKELEAYISATDPTGDTYEANLLRGENEALRAELDELRSKEYNAEVIQNENEWLKDYLQFHNDQG